MRMGLCFHLLPLHPSLINLLKSLLQALGDAPLGVMRFHLAQVAIVADVVAAAVLLVVAIAHRFAADVFDPGEGFQDGDGVVFAAAEVIDFGDAGLGDEGLDEARHVVGMDVVAHLLAFVAKDGVFPFFQVALDQVAEETVQLYARMAGTSEAAAAQGAGGHVEVAAVLLHADVSGHFGSAEERVLALVDAEALGDALGVLRVGVVPAGFQLDQRDLVGGVTIDFVGGQVYERDVGAVLPGGFQQVEGAYGIGVEVVERDGGRPVVAGLGGRVDDGVGGDVAHQAQHARPVADVELVVLEVAQFMLQTLLVPAGIAG
jgi:hypothetical protein